MILKQLKSNQPINLLLFPAIALLFWLTNLLNPFAYRFLPGESNNVLFAFINRTTDGYAFVRVALSLVLIIFIATAVQVVNDRYSFIYIRSKLPASLFVIIVSGLPQLHTLHPVFPATLFLMFALFNLLGIFEKAKPYNTIFNAGLFLGIGTLFYLNLIFLLPAFIISIFILSHEYNWRNYVILFIGFILPAIFTFSYAFLTDSTNELLSALANSFSTQPIHFHIDIAMYVFLAFLIILTIAGSIKIMMQYATKKVSTRKYFAIFLILFVSLLLSLAFVPGTSLEILVVAAVPVTYLISNLFIFMKSKFWSEFLFILLLAIVIFMQLADKFSLNI